MSDDSKLIVTCPCEECAAHRARAEAAERVILDDLAEMEKNRSDLIELRAIFEEMQARALQAEARGAAVEDAVRRYVALVECGIIPDAQNSLTEFRAALATQGGSRSTS